MKQYMEAIHRDQFMPIFDRTPVSLKTKLLEVLGIKVRVCNFYTRQYITASQYETMQEFEKNNELMMPSIIGEPAFFDLEQLEKYSKALIKLIIHMDGIKSSRAEHLQKSRLVTEQGMIQKRINEHKRKL